jgi:hypothetical protein
VLLSFYVLSSLIVNLNSISSDHSSSEKKSISSYLLFSRSETQVKGSGVLRSKARCLRSP